MQTFKWPLRPRLDGKPGVLPGGEARESGDRDHRGIVGAELDTRIMHAQTLPRCCDRKRIAQGAIRTNSTRDDQCVEPGCLERAQCLRHERRNDRILNATRDISAARRVEVTLQ